MRTLNTEYFDMLEKYIDDYRRKNGYCPTLLEMEKELGIPKSTAARYIKYMSEHGMIEVKGRGRISTRSADAENRQTVLLPILGAVSCGIPKFAEENIEEYVRVPASWFGGGEFFALRADGDSMINAGIDDGDLVIIRRQGYAASGQIVVALIDNEEATLKRYRPHADRQFIDLVPENDKFSVRTVDLGAETLIIQGVAVKVLKDLE